MEREETIGRLQIIRRDWMKDSRAWVTIYNANSKARIRKPMYNHLFKSWDQAEAFIARILSAEADRIRQAEEQKRARAEFVHDYKPGDILVASWGWEQTNVDFYQVTDVPSPKSIGIRPIESRYTDKPTGNSMAGFVLPVPDSFSGDRQVKRVNIGNQVRFESYRYAHKWEGREQYSSWYA